MVMSPIQIPDTNLWVIGDVHACWGELAQLVLKLPKGATWAFVGDFVDRGPRPVETLMFVDAAIRARRAYAVLGNHDWKVYRAVNLSRNVKFTDELYDTVSKVRPEDTEFLGTLPHQLTFEVPDGRKVTVAHGGLPFSCVGEDNKFTQNHCLYGETNGEVNENGYPVRTYEWVDSWKDASHVCVYGHTPVPQVDVRGHTINVDTGCAFGGMLTAYNPFTQTIRQVPAITSYSVRG